jgi:NTE family protein
MASSSAPAARRPRKIASAASAALPSPLSAPLDLALQGGGSHGAFTWGVLDRLLQDDTLNIAAVSGTSAGALNAAVMACGWANGGREGARVALSAFWHDVGGQSACFGAAGASLADPHPGADLSLYNLSLHPAYAWFNGVMRLFSPQQLNPLGLDPLRRIVERHVQAAALRDSPLRVFVTATQVRTGQPRIFDNMQGDGGQADLDIPALLASACLPQVFRPVMIDGEAYWDGGYSGNPALWPLIYRTPATDLLLVRINALSRPSVPDTAAEIADRVNEITFNAGLLGELRAIAFVQKLVAEGRLDAGQYKNLRLHMVADDASLAPLGASSKLNTSLVFLRRLHALGRAAADTWLQSHRGDIGVRATLDIRKTFLGQGA